MVITFALQQLSTVNHGDDYKELLELTVIFLGGIPPKGIKFRDPWLQRHFTARVGWHVRSMRSRCGFSGISFPLNNARAQRGHLDNPTLKRCGIIYFECPFL